MNVCQSDVLKKSILEMVETEISQPYLKEQLKQYVSFQSNNGFLFGELFILHYQMFNGKMGQEVYKVAAAIEALILSFDILDDFEDEDSLTNPWFNEPNLALNATTALLFVSAKVIQNTQFHNKNEAIAMLFEYALQSISGQHQDLLNIVRTEAEYIEMTMEKSGSLTKLACMLGVVLATGDCPNEVKEYPRLIGLIGQISNDILDLTTWEDKNDLVNKKYTLPIIYLLNHADQKFQTIRDYYDGKMNVSEILSKQQWIAQDIKESGAITYTEVVKRVQQNKAMLEIGKLNVEQQYLAQLKKYIY